MSTFGGLLLIFPIILMIFDDKKGTKIIISKSNQITSPSINNRSQRCVAATCTLLNLPCCLVTLVN